MYAECHERKYFYDEDAIFPWGPRELSPYADEIRQQIANEVLPEAQGRGLACYLHNELLNRKVYQISPDVVVENGLLWSKTKVESYGPLSTTEQEAVKDYLQGQFSDGWGEGFCQREIPISDEEALFVYFYPLEPGSDPTLYNEEEFAQLLGLQEPELRM